MPGGIYCIENLINNKMYIGKSVNIANRWEYHKSRLNRNKHTNQKLQRAFNKYGKDNFKFYVLELCDYELLNSKEMFYIKIYDSFINGYNLSVGGDGHNKYEISDETRTKLSNAGKQKISEEIKQKISATLKGHVAANKTPKEMIIKICIEIEEGKLTRSEMARKHNASIRTIYRIVSKELKAG